MTKLSFVFILSFLYACGNKQQTTSLKKVDESQLELIHKKAISYPNQTQLSIGLITNGKVDFLGIQKENSHILSVGNQSNIFEIGSITKVFTSTILAQFALDKKFKLNDEISQYIETPLKNHSKISFVQLANHTSGLPRLPTNLDVSLTPDNPYKDYGEEKLKEYLSGELVVSNRVENDYEYSNIGFGLLGFVLTQIGNKNYETIVQEKIFSKFSMSNSTTDHKNTKGLLIKSLNDLVSSLRLFFRAVWLFG